MQTKKLLKRVAIVLLIAVFSLAGIVACGGAEDIAGSRGGGDTIVEPGQTGPVDPEPTPEPTPEPNPEPEPTPDPEPEPTPTFPANTYYKIYAPWVKWDESQAPNGWRTNVSYQDTNTLTQIWKQQIAGGKYNDDRRWFIRDMDNRHNDHRLGNYYYFDKDFNIVYYRQGKGSLTVRKFISGIIVKYSGGRNAGTWAIGGLYETLFDKNEITDNRLDSLNYFMGENAMRAKKGGLEVLTMNTGYDDLYQNEFGVDFYFNTKDGDKSHSLEEHFNKKPEELNNFLNGKRNLSYKLGLANVRFVFNRSYDWHLTDHLNQKGWH